MLTRDQILAAGATAAREVHPVEVAAWGGTVGVRRMSVGQALDWTRESDPGRRAALLVRNTACDGEGNLLFTDDDVSWLAEQPQVVLQPIVTAALDFNGLGARAAEDARGN